MFRRKRREVPTPTRAQAALDAVTAELIAARGRVAAIERRRERLREVEAAAEPAQRTLQNAIADDHAEALACIASGRTRPDVQALIADAESASAAARAAIAAMPEADRHLAEAEAEIRRLAEMRMRRVSDVLVERLDQVGKEYAAAWRRLCELHDRIAGAAAGAGSVVRFDVKVTDDEISAPRFRLPSVGTLGHNSSFAPYYVHTVPEPSVFNRARDEWTRAALELAAEPKPIT